MRLIINNRQVSTITLPLYHRYGSKYIYFTAYLQ